MAKHAEAPQVYQAMSLFEQRCLRADGSLLWDGEDVWTKEHVELLIERLVRTPDESDRDFWTKLEDQLHGLPGACYKIVADAFVVYSLPSTFMRPQKKWENVTEVCRLGGMPEPALRSPVKEALSQGFSRTSQRYHAKYMQLWLILLAAAELKNCSDVERNRILDDPHELAELLDRVMEPLRRQDRAYDMRHAVLHMLFPTHFVRSISSRDKEQIVETYAGYLPAEATDESVDRKIFLIKERLREERGVETVDFYAPEFKRDWRADPSGQTAPGAEEDDGASSEPDPLLEQLFRPLAETGQLILYGPPGTGKTYYARRLAETIIAANNFDKDDVSALTDEERDMLRIDGVARSSQMAWWCVANPGRWSRQDDAARDTVDFSFGRIQQNFHEAQVGDLVFAYEATPKLAVTAVARVKDTLHHSNQGQVITLQRVALLENPIPYEDIRKHPVLQESQPVRLSNRGTLFRIEPGEARHLLQMIREHNPHVSEHIEAEPQPEVSYLRMCTFHPAYGYEEFVEGYRPYLSEDGTPHFQIQDGIFKRLCRDARQEPDRTFVLIIDEINRGNIPRIFGELITLIERDKRWRPGGGNSLSVELPISRESFSVPENVYIIATMNTADKSIAVLDTALRRRFAFRELMPEPGLLAGIELDGIPLDGLLTALNERIVKALDRNLQIGHAYFLNDGEPLGTPTALATVLRDKVLPLLQDYCYDDYGRLQEILGSGLVDEGQQRFRPEVMAPGPESELLREIGRLVQGGSGSQEP